jgi:hypothetical protein
LDAGGAADKGVLPLLLAVPVLRLGCHKPLLDIF